MRDGTFGINTIKTMSITLDKFRAKLVVKILYADSGYATERYVRAAVRSMLHKNVNSYILSRFIGRVNSQLCNFKSPSTPLQQLANIRAATYVLQHMRDSMGLQALSLQ